MGPLGSLALLTVPLFRSPAPFCSFWCPLFLPKQGQASSLSLSPLCTEAGRGFTEALNEEQARAGPEPSPNLAPHCGTQTSWPSLPAPNPPGLTTLVPCLTLPHTLCVLWASPCSSPDLSFPTYRLGDGNQMIFKAPAPMLVFSTLPGAPGSQPLCPGRE